MITLAKILFLLFLKLRMQIFPKKFFFPTVSLVFTNIPLQGATDIAVNLGFNHLDLDITKKDLKKMLPFCYITDSFF